MRHASPKKSQLTIYCPECGEPITEKLKRFYAKEIIELAKKARYLMAQAKKLTAKP